MGNKERNLGHRLERELAALFRSLGFTHCRTTREESKLLDSCGIDLSNLPYNVQAKSGKQRSLNYSKELKSIKEKINNNLPDDHVVKNNPNVIIHKKYVGQGKRREEYDTLVILSLNDFVKIINNE